MKAILARKEAVETPAAAATPRDRQPAAGSAYRCTPGCALRSLHPHQAARLAMVTPESVAQSARLCARR